eukprot:5362302-Pyramimonas_sp.AAC.1
MCHVLQVPSSTDGSPERPRTGTTSLSPVSSNAVLVRTTVGLPGKLKAGRNCAPPSGGWGRGQGP